MKSLLLVFAFLCSWDTASFNPLSSEVHKKCYKNGTCRYECYGSEMLVAYCMYKLECCVTGDPGP
uniref:Defensin beta 134 n=1 Tax=Marmota marmota marmota TaxID=9994 RepID=A0A8C6ETH0_MARMA